MPMALAFARLHQLVLQVAMRMGHVEFMTHQSENALLLDMVVTFVAASIDCS